MLHAYLVPTWKAQDVCANSYLLVNLDLVLYISRSELQVRDLAGSVSRHKLNNCSQPVITRKTHGTFEFEAQFVL